MYTFIDVNESSACTALPAEAVSINGVFIENVIDGYRTLSVTGRELHPAELDVREVKGINGSEFRNRRYPSRTIIVTYKLQAATPQEFREKYNKLNGILSQEEAVVIFADEPDKFFIATKSDASDPDKGRLAVVGTYSLFCCDGFKYSMSSKEFLAVEGIDGILEMNIINDGTVAVPVDYKITHKHENGFIGIVSDHGVIQLGYAQESDETIKNKSEVLANYTVMSDFQTDAALNVGSVGYPGVYPFNGTTNIVERSGYSWLAPDNLGAGNGWHGVTRTIKLPPDSCGKTGPTKFQANAKLMFESTNAGQVGWMAFAVSDTNGEPLASIHIWKSKWPSSIATLQFNVGLEGKRIVEFTADISSPFVPTAGQVYIRKDGELFEFYCAGQRYQYRVPEYADKGAGEITVFFGQMKDWGYTWTPWMGVNLVRFQTNSTEYVYDIPNRYADKSVITIDGKKAKVYTDGVATQGDEIVGSRYFLAEPGENIIKVVVSEFCRPLPEVTGSIREAWL